MGGCVPQAERNLKGLENCSIVGVSQIDKIDYIVKNTFEGNVVRLLEKKLYHLYYFQKLEEINLLK